MTVEPFFTLRNNKLELSYLNHTQEKLKFYLYDANTDKLLYEKELKPKFAVNYGLDLSQLKNGEYDAVLAGNDHFYEYEMVLD